MDDVNHSGAQIVSDAEDGVTVVDVRGQFDADAIDGFRAALRTALGRGAPVLIDLIRCSFMDSAGLAVLLDEVAGARVRLAIALEAEGAPHYLFQVTRAEASFELHPSRDTAIRAITGT